MKRKLIGIGAVVLVLALLLTLAPSCGKGEEKTPTPGFTPTPGVTPTPTPGVKTLKMGLLTPLSGPAAPWGLEFERGAVWAVDRINEAGGFKVGADTYMIKIVKGDTKFIGSEGAKEATRLVLEEGIHYIVGPVAVYRAIGPIVLEGKCFVFNMTNSPLVSPENPYQLMGPAEVGAWYGTFWDQAYQFHPEIQTVAIISPEGTTYDPHLAACEAAHAKHGREVVIVRRYTAFTTDYYPTLTPVVAKNPDAIDFDGGNVGDIALMVKQARELGYEGILAGPAFGDAATAINIAGPEFAEGFIVNGPDYGCELYPEATRELYTDFQQRYPGIVLPFTTYLTFGGVNFFVQAIQTAGSIDPDEVMKVLDDPDWEFDWFGMPGRSLGGEETLGINRCLQDEVGYAEVVNGVHVMKSHEVTLIP